jgi:release factor glutamine methyltransferase
MTLREALQQAAQTIARRDAEVLAQHLLARDRAWLLAHPEFELPPAQTAQFLALTTRRSAHVPLQHLTGVQEFFGRPFAVNSDVLIPRPETELLVEAVLHWLRERNIDQPHILDVGTGSGAIAVTLALELPKAHVTAVDLSPAALAVARQNAARLGANVRFLQSDLLRALFAGQLAGQPAEQLAEQLAVQPPFDAIVSNPPYVPLADASTLAPEVVDHEPHLALFAADAGLAVYRQLLPQAHAALRPGGLLAMEFGFGQREALRDLIASHLTAEGPPAPRARWTEPRFRDDYAAIPRIVLTERL